VRVLKSPLPTGKITIISHAVGLGKMKVPYWFHRGPDVSLQKMEIVVVPSGAIWPRTRKMLNFHCPKDYERKPEIDERSYLSSATASLPSVQADPKKMDERYVSSVKET
jgi:hypothetical protein